MRQHILNTYARTLDLAQRLVADVPCERFAEFPHDGAKHPAWVLTHLCIASGMGVEHIGAGPSGIPEAWAEVSMPGSELLADRARYATKDELLGHLVRVHGLLAEGFTNASDELLARDFPIAEYRAFFPTIGDAAFYLMAFHEAWHLGQLSAWRRAAGFAAPQ